MSVNETFDLIYRYRLVKLTDSIFGLKTLWPILLEYWLCCCGILMKKYDVAALLLVFSFSSQTGLAYSELDELKKIANHGDVRAQSQLGGVYLFGEYGLDIDYKKAFTWYSKAAKQGDAKSQYNLAIMYLNGYGTDKNAVKAVGYYKKAAVQGDSDSQLQLGIRYLQGEGVEYNLEQAKYWFKKAEQSGNSEANQYVNMLEK